MHHGRSRHGRPAGLRRDARDRDHHTTVAAGTTTTHRQPWESSSTVPLAFPDRIEWTTTSPPGAWMAELTRDVALARAHGEAARNYYAARPGLDLKDGPIVAVHHAASFSDHY